MANKQVAKKQESELPAALLAEYAEFTPTFDRDEVQLPFLRVLQQLSPQVIEGDSNHVEGAKPGMLYHTINGQVYTDLSIVVLRKEIVKIQWRMRDQGGGFVAQFNPGDPDIPKTHKVEYENVVTDDPSTVLQDTIQYVCRVFDQDCVDLGMAIISCSRSQLKVARVFNTRMANAKIPGMKVVAPPFAFTYALSTVMEKNDRGTFYSFRFGAGEPIADAEMAGETIALARQVNDIQISQVQEEEPVSSTTSTAL